MFVPFHILIINKMRNREREYRMRIHSRQRFIALFELKQNSWYYLSRCSFRYYIKCVILVLKVYSLT